MDFEDGKRRLGLVVAACGRRGGLRWGVCLPSQDGRMGFVLPARRPPALRGPSARTWPPRRPARRYSVRRVSTASGESERSVLISVRRRKRTEREGPGVRAPDSPCPPVRADCPPLLQLPGLGQRGERAAPARLALAPRGGDPDRPFS